MVRRNSGAAGCPIHSRSLRMSGCSRYRASEGSQSDLIPLDTLWDTFPF